MNTLIQRCWLVVFYGISTLVGHSIPNPAEMQLANSTALAN